MCKYTILIKIIIPFCSICRVLNINKLCWIYTINISLNVWLSKAIIFQWDLTNGQDYQDGITILEDRTIGRHDLMIEGELADDISHLEVVQYKQERGMIRSTIDNQPIIHRLCSINCILVHVNYICINIANKFCYAICVHTEDSYL